MCRTLCRLLRLTSRNVRRDFHRIKASKSYSKQLQMAISRDDSILHTQQTTELLNQEEHNTLARDHKNKNAKGHVTNHLGLEPNTGVEVLPLAVDRSGSPAPRRTQGWKRCRSQYTGVQALPLAVETSRNTASRSRQVEKRGSRSTLE